MDENTFKIFVYYHLEKLFFSAKLFVSDKPKDFVV